MKQFYFLLIGCALFLLAGCANDNSVMPESNITQKTWISLPQAAGVSIESSLFTSSKINGNQGGELLLQGSYQSNINTTVTFDSRLQIPTNAFYGSRVLTEETGYGAYIDFGPAMVFNVPLILDFTVSGLDLTGIDPNQINFYYLSPTGSLELTQNDGVVVNTSTGTLKVIRARIPHFSRYGWAK